MDPIALSIPAFFILMGVEWGVSKWRGVEVYRFADWVANLGCGIVQQTFKVVLALFTGLGYIYLYREYRVYDLGADRWWVWLLCFLGVDFFYYWFHRLSHELNFMWAAHVVHHQSEEYNLGVALRQSAFQSIFSSLFYLPLAVVGFSPLVTGVVLAINTLYQFWIHTQLIGRLGPLEWILNTPSHHRVHHGQNPQYIDRNHAGTLIIWDRMFGTFEPEGEDVIYGVTEPPNSWNPIFANFHHLGLTFSRMRQARRWKDKIWVWLERPGYVPEGASDAAKRVDPLSKYDTAVGPTMLVYVTIQFFALLAAVVTYLFFRKLIDPWPLAAWGTSIIVTAGTLGALLDGVRWVRFAEFVRPALISVVFVALLPDQLFNGPSVAGLALLSALSVVGLVFVLKGEAREAVEPLGRGGASVGA